MIGIGTPSARQRGFSFIEILVVMGIISVLVGGIVFAIGIWAEKQPEFQTKNLVNKVNALIDDWHRVFEMYPPSDVTRLADVTGMGEKAQAPANNINAPIESIYQALFWKGYKADPQWGDDEIKNLDEDELRKGVNRYETKALNEIVDAFGNPLVYFNRDDYVKYADGGAEYMSHDREGAEIDVEPLPYRNEDGTFRHPETFQLWSMGPDGEPNTDDDITPWGD